jgi:hypothetical protein
MMSAVSIHKTTASADAARMAVPRVVPPIVAILCGVFALSCVVGAGAAGMLGRIVPGASPAWIMLGFEVIGILTGAIGVLFAMGRFREAPGMALACVAGTVFSVAVCTHLAVRGTLGPHSLAMLTVGRIGAAGVLGVLAAVCVLSRNPRSVGMLLKGVVLGVPTLAVVGALIVTRGEVVENVLKSLGNWGSVWRFVILSIGGLVVGGTLCASVEFVVRAFQMGDAENPGNAASGSAVAGSAVAGSAVVTGAGSGTAGGSVGVGAGKPNGA